MAKGNLGAKFLLPGSVAILAAASSALANHDDHRPILKRLDEITTIASTVPANGDVNPYGVARVRRSVGNLRAGHILVSNFNNSDNKQGKGTTIVDVAPDGQVAVFAQIDAGSLPGPCPGGVGLTTALVVLRTGWVIVGSLPTADGTPPTAQAGCLIVLNSLGKPVETFSGAPINGPWDMTALDNGHDVKLFVTNVLNGTVAGGGQVVNQGTVVRIDLDVSEMKKPSVDSTTVIGSGFPETTDPAALVIGPTGVGLSPCDDDDKDDDHDADRCERVLYVADTIDDRIAAIDHPVQRKTSDGIGRTFSWGGSLNAPLGLIVSREGHVLTVNGGDGFIVEISPRGAQIARRLLDNTGGPPPGAGTLFGLDFDAKGNIEFVDDGTNTLNLLH